MNSFTGRRTRPRRSHHFADMQEESKSKIKDLQWLVYFFEDGKVMIVSVGFSGTAANSSACAGESRGRLHLRVFGKNYPCPVYGKDQSHWPEVLHGKMPLTSFFGFQGAER